MSTTVTGANQITLVLDQGVIGPTGPAGVGPTGPSGSGLEVKGIVNTPAELPSVGNITGDTYIVVNP